MKLGQIALMTAVFLSAIHSVSGAEPGAAPTDGREQKVVVDGINAFGLDLYGKLKEQQGNIFFSPFSISTALAMTYAGARGDTEKEMAQTLHFGRDQANVHPAFAGLVAQLVPTQEQTAGPLSVANAIWLQKGDRLLQGYVELTGKYYGSGIREVDFGDPNAATRAINDWVAQATNQLIRGLIPPGALEDKPRLVLTNAILFQGKWRRPFLEKYTRDATFKLENDTSVMVRMMRSGGYTRYGTFGDVQMCLLPYEGERYSMLILLPKDAGAMSILESQLTVAAVDKWVKGMTGTEVIVTMPRCTMTGEFSLKEALEGLGTKSAFAEGGADFSGMDGRRDLFISKVLHKAFVDINEEGTKAGAATAVVGATTDGGSVIEFRADHPFIFMIRDDKTGSILFIGRMMNPKE